MGGSWWARELTQTASRGFITGKADGTSIGINIGIRIAAYRRAPYRKQRLTWLFSHLCGEWLVPQHRMA